MWICIIAAIISALGMLTLSSAAAAEDDWQILRNPRYGFSLAYPNSLFTLEKTTESGDGHFLRAQPPGARLVAGVIVNEQGHTPKSYMRYVASRSYAQYKITYRKVGPSWFAISGESNGWVFYEKVQFSCNADLISSFAIIYPSSSQRVLNPVIERMEDSFRSARYCRGGKSLPTRNMH